MSSTLGYLVTQKMPGLTVEGVETITMVICCDYSYGLVLLQLFGEILHVSLRQHSIRRGRILHTVHKCEGLDGNRERSPYCKARVSLYISLCAWVCACFFACL